MMTYIFGWDGASYQGVPNVAQLKAEGHDFCIEKVTGEGSYVNPVWSAVRDACRAAGVIFGSYDWVMPQEWGALTDATSAARDYLATLGQRQAGELLTVDFEEAKWSTGPLGRNIEQTMKAYLYTLRDEGGQPVIVYTAPYFLAETGASGWAWLGQDFHLWQAAPGPGMMADDSFWPATPAPFARTLLHQHQWTATSGAVVGQFDRDRFDGTVDELRAYGYPGEVTAAMVAKDPVQAITEALGATNATGEDVRPYVDAQGRAHVDICFGGTAATVVGVNSVDIGISVVNADGETFDRSVQANVFQPWRKR